MWRMQGQRGVFLLTLVVAVGKVSNFLLPCRTQAVIGPRVCKREDMNALIERVNSSGVDFEGWDPRETLQPLNFQRNYCVIPHKMCFPLEYWLFHKCDAITLIKYSIFKNSDEREENVLRGNPFRRVRMSVQPHPHSMLSLNPLSYTVCSFIFKTFNSFDWNSFLQKKLCK